MKMPAFRLPAPGVVKAKGTTVDKVRKASQTYIDQYACFS